MSSKGKKHVSAAKRRMSALRRAMKQQCYRCEGCKHPIRGDHLFGHADVCTGDPKAAQRQCERLFGKKATA